MLNKLKKLKGRSINEIRVRVKQKASALAEKNGLSKDSRLPSDAEFARLLNQKITLEHFRTRSAPKFFKAFQDEEKTKEILYSSFNSKLLIERADKICGGRFDLLGFEDLFFGEPVDWLFEPITKTKMPLPHWSEVIEVDSTDRSDKKIVWELNRCQHFITLGRAYWQTGEEKYAERFIELIEGWMAQNKPKFGMNWMSSLEIGFRSISWLWAFYFFKDSPRLKEDTFHRAVKFLYLHARHLENYLSIYSSPNTHLTGEALGLFYLGLLLPEFKRAKQWLKTGSKVLHAELDRHILNDGVYVERASYYQRYTTDFYLHVLLLSEANGLDVSDKLRTKLQASLNHLMHITRPDGTTPFFGDDDGGRLLFLDERPRNDFRSTLAVGASVFKRGDYKFVAETATEEVLFLTGSSGLNEFENLNAESPKDTSIAFLDGGYYVMRDSWTKESNWMLIDCGEHGFLNCGHAHADALSFELVAKGKTMLVDPGTFVYASDIETRNWFRSTAAHNCLVVDRQSSSTPEDAFSWKRTANCKTLSWINHKRFDFFAGEHDGYKPVAHNRNILFLKNNYWIVCDEIRTNETHDYRWNFHFAPGVKPEFSFTCKHDSSDERELLSFACETKEGVGFVCYPPRSIVTLDKYDGWVSTCYGSRENAEVVYFHLNNQIRLVPEPILQFVYFMFPYSGREKRPHLQLLNSEKKHYFEISTNTGNAHFFLKGGKAIETKDVFSDFKFTWIQYDNKNELEELILIDGKSFTFRGQNLVSFKNPSVFVYAKRENGKFVIETKG